MWHSVGDVETFKRRRAAELKHGRICMFADMPHGIAAISKEGWVQIVLFLGHYEGYFWRQDPKRAPGDYEGAGKNFIFNFEPIDWMLTLMSGEDPEVRKTKLAAEIANGRLAMVALMAMFLGTPGAGWEWCCVPVSIGGYRGYAACV
eukprot:Skav234130  [mRNA]  locus=scaffold753:187205:189613:- [translate_table: standard]